MWVDQIIGSLIEERKDLPHQSSFMWQPDILHDIFYEALGECQSAASGVVIKSNRQHRLSQIQSSEGVTNALSKHT